MTTDELVRQLEAERAQPIPPPKPETDTPAQIAARVKVLTSEYPRAGA